MSARKREQKLSEPRSRRGARILRRIHGWGTPNVLGPLEKIAPDLKGMVRDFAFGEVYARPGLALKQRQLVTVAALAALHHSPLELKAHLFAALKVGWKREELVEALMQIALYAGFPAAVGALHVAREVFEEMDARGKSEPRK